MGNGQSLFYPDNGNRHDRAQQLANDCQYYKALFETKKAALEKELGPYQAKINEVMRAFGCNDLDDLNRLVQDKANGEALEHWNSVKDFYDKTVMIDQVLFGIMGIVAVAGLSISIIGALAGGIGFFAGIAVTGEILLFLGILGLFLDAIFGAINRAKLQEAINKLFPARIKMKRALSQLENLETWTSAIKAMYQSFEGAGDSKDAIIARLKELKFDDEVKVGVKSFYQIASELRSLDESRSSWTNEDPDWQSTGRWLDASGTFGGIFKWLGVANTSIASDSFASPMMNLSVVESDIAPTPPVFSQKDEAPSFEVTLKAYVDGIVLSDLLNGVLTLEVKGVVDDFSAVVIVWNEKGTSAIQIVDHKVVQDRGITDKNWILAFGHVEGTERFKKFWPSNNLEIEVTLYSESGEGYLCADGTLSPEKILATRFLAKYAQK